MFLSTLGESMSESVSVEFHSSRHDLPFSQAVRIGQMYYLSGQIGIDQTGRLVEGFDEQATQTMRNISDVLESVGLGFRDVVKCTIMLKDMSLWEKFNKVYLTFFDSGNLPTRSAFGATALAYGAEMEVEVWAVDTADARTGLLAGR
jgi:2-iminobutanoate/2-iminopropanoate deaminase